MFELVVFTLGVVVGWNTTQPEWAKDIQKKVVSFFN